MMRKDLEHREWEATSQTAADQEVERTWRMDGDPVPVLGLGTYGLNGKGCTETVSAALSMGYRHLDTAQMYGNEKEVGAGIKTSGISREGVFVTTQNSTDHMEPKAIVSSVENSVQLLDTDYADLLLIHWPVPGMDLEACLDAMFGLMDRDLIRHAGVSNFHADHFRKAMDHGPVKCNQVEFSPFVDQHENLATAKYAGALITAYSPLAKGRASRDDLLMQLGRVYGKTAAQITLRWLIQQGDVAVIPKAGDRQHLEENMQIFDFELSPEDMNKIFTLNR